MIKYDTECLVKANDLALRLSVTETRGEALDLIVQTYTQTGSLDKTAEELDVGLRTLQRWISKTPELARRIQAARLERAPLR